MEYKVTPISPQDLGLPHKTWWSGQREGVEQIVDLWKQGVMVVMVNGPTGAGKSLTGRASASLWAQIREDELDCTVLTQTRDLQAQYVGEFPDCKAATGRGNWGCYEAPGERASHCPLIGTPETCSVMCPYRRQRDAAKDAPMRAINYALYGATGDLFHAPIMITDEADYLGELLVNSRSVDMTQIVLEYGLEVDGGEVNKKEMIGKVQEIMEESALPEERETCKHALELLSQHRYMVKGVGDFLVPWPESRVVQDFAKQPTLIMSATVFAPQYWAKEWNIPVGWVELPCAVPKENRPIRLMNVAKINKDTSEFEWQKVISALDKIIAERVESKGLIHSVSNWLTEFIMKYSKYSYLMIRASGEGRLAGINKFLKQDKGILIGPNLLRGLNLNDEHCRWIVFPKVPFPSMGDPRVKEMMKGGNDRYYVETLGAIIQGAGRGIRNREDYCETFILDSGASYLFKQTSALQPNWFREAIVYN